jgi:hypothetical protein
VGDGVFAIQSSDRGGAEWSFVIEGIAVEGEGDVLTLERNWKENGILCFILGSGCAF